jgi:SCP-2 sterol transfer family protein
VPGGIVSEPIEEFFERLTRSVPDRLRRADGSLRIDLTSGTTTERWFVTMHGGDVSVSHRNAKADSVIRTSKDQFEGMVTGRVNAMSAALRGVVSLEGDPSLLVLFQRALPGPPSTATGDGAAATGRRT